MAIKNVNISTTEAESIYSKSYLRTKSLYITNETFLSSIFSKGTSFNKIGFMNSLDSRLLYTQSKFILFVEYMIEQFIPQRVIQSDSAEYYLTSVVDTYTILPR